MKLQNISLPDRRSNEMGKTTEMHIFRIESRFCRGSDTLVIDTDISGHLNSSMHDPLLRIIEAYFHICTTLSNDWF